MAESVEQFLARGGKVETVASGQRTMSDREIWARTAAPDNKHDKVIGRLPNVDLTEASMREAENMGALDIQAYRKELMG